MSFIDLHLDKRYRSDEHSFPADFLIPVLSRTKIYKVATGYFSTSSLVHISMGLFELCKNGGKIQIVCSPNLSQEDIDAINFGYKKRDEVIVHALLREIREPIDYYEETRLNLVATMIANGTMDIKVAFLETEEGIQKYHEKISVFIDDEDNVISYAGSANTTGNGVDGNFESIYIFCSWIDESQLQYSSIAQSDFEKLWNDNTNKLKVIEFPKIVAERLMNYKKEYDLINWDTDRNEYGYESYIKPKKDFCIPEDVNMHNYQEEAVQNWFSNGRKGVFDMCTGAGKTYTALYAITKLADRLGELAVFIVCPYIHLVSQWEEDVEKWCNVPILIAHSKSLCKDWKSELVKYYKRFKKDKKSFVCITTNDTFADKMFQDVISHFDEKQNVMLIADEAHNFGSAHMKECMPSNISNRIALSATFERYMDLSGTENIKKYFGKKCITYSLEQAIEDGNLVHYLYYPIVVALNSDELEKYEQLTKKINRCIVVNDGKTKISDAGKTLIYERTRLLAGCQEKIPKLMALMNEYKNENNILVYCGATNVEEDGELFRQIDLVTSKLQQEYKMSVKRFTSEENLVDRQNIKKFFAQGMYQVITAIKCLDEGVNIPGIKTAFILSSSRNPKEFIQRRGRLLRKSDNKACAVIYDFVTLPRSLDDIVPDDIAKDKTIVVGELARMVEFGKLADNSEVSDEIIARVMDAYEYYFDVEEEMKSMEENYSE